MLISPVFIACLGVAALLAWVGGPFLLRRRRRVAAVGTMMLAVLLTTATAADAANGYFAYLPDWKDLANVVQGGDRDWVDFTIVSSTPPGRLLQRHPKGMVTRLRMPDRGSGFGATRALVYLPPQYFTDRHRRFPVLYLFHGSPGVPGDWFRAGEAGRMATRLATTGRPVIVVAPRMSHGWRDDPECVDGAHERVESHFLQDVVPVVDAQLRTIPDRDHRVFGGMSAGGYCALNLGLRNRPLTSTIIDLSGFTRPTHTGGMKALFGRAPNLPQVVAANTPATYGQTLSAAPTTRIWMDCGKQDHEVLTEMHSLAPVLVKRGIPTAIHLRPGSHTYHVWVPALNEALDWAFPRDLPTSPPIRPASQEHPVR